MGRIAKEFGTPSKARRSRTRMFIQQAKRDVRPFLAAGLLAECRRIGHDDPADRHRALATIMFNSSQFSKTGDLAWPKGLASQLPSTAGMMLNLNYRTELIELGCKNWWPARDHEIAETKSAEAVLEQRSPVPPRFAVPPEYALFVIELA